MKTIIKMMRVKHYIKNLLVFIPLVFSSHLFNTDLLLKAFLGFISFSFLSSAVYIVNDLKDIKKDRLHPTKSKRPIASGSVSLGTAIFVMVCCLLAFTVSCYYSAGHDPLGWLVAGSYFVLNIAYSFGLKNIPILDIAVLASGFLLRVIFGAIAVDVWISNWLYLTVLSLSFYLGLGKRRNELKNGSETRTVLNHYNIGFLDKFMYVTLTLGIIFYALWSVDTNTIERLGNTQFIWTVPIVILIGMKYSLAIEADSDGDPVEVIWKDKALIVLVSLYVLVVMGIIYL